MANADRAMMEQMARLKLRLLEKKLEQKREGREDGLSTATSSGSDGNQEALHGALRRRKDLLHRLREQHMLDEMSRPRSRGDSRRRQRFTPPVVVPRFVPFIAPRYLPPPPPPPPPPATAAPRLEPIHIYQQAPPQAPRIIQQQMPQQPTTIIQQMPPQPLIQQIAGPAPLPPLRSGNIKEDMVDLMMMQNAQMHQVVMQNMMLKAMPAPAPTPARAVPQDSSPEQPGVHHHHYGPPQPPLPPIGFPGWPQSGVPYAHGSPFPMGGYPGLGGGPYGTAPYHPGYQQHVAGGAMPPMMPVQTTEVTGLIPHLSSALPRAL
ncbi:uncharacterized protein C21orf58-like isoform X2 [Lethenteron reissneri]|uniref:uncharacterized protein C21orf58-like isoform X2 n=1 Tax=Lethenteron reissneri TaxID=7753 RepID=UPI002AB6497D|nr:uncharacterized protein C21orf58-like isoform X2 [Lethenteron reissneri]